MHAIERRSCQATNLATIGLNLVFFDRAGNPRQDKLLPGQVHFEPESAACAEFAGVVKPILGKVRARAVGLP
jgi:hypothetical protein